MRLVSIVDDDESLRRSVKNLLTSVGFRVETFASAEAFLESAHRAETRCVVLDLRMPGMSGVDLLMHLAAAGSRGLEQPLERPRTRSSGPGRLGP